MNKHSAFIWTLLLYFAAACAAELKFIPVWSGMELPPGVVEKGNALCFASRGCVTFKDPAIYAETGSISMDFQLNYDPSDGALIKENLAWRNQTLFTIERTDKIFAQGYMTINGGRTSICFGVFQKGKPALFVTSAKFQFEKGKTYRVVFEFGKEVLIYIDGRQVVANPRPWRGLFGETAPASIASFTLGASQIGGIANNCSIGNIQVISRNLGNERISVPKLATQPQTASFENISAILKDKGVAICGFCDAGKLLEKRQAKVALAYSDDGIYFTAYIPTADGAAPRAMETKHDGAVWRDDALEIRIQPKNKGPVHVFIGNAAGTCMDGIQPPGNIKNADWAPNPTWHFSARKGEDAWQATGFIPFSSLDCKGAPPPGSTWKASFSIGRPSGAGATLSQANASCYPDPDGFPELLFTGTVQSLGLEDIGDFATGHPRMAFHVTQSREPVVSIQARLHDAAGREIDNWQFRLNDQLDAVYMPPELPEGLFSIIIQGSNSHGLELFRRFFCFRTEKKSSLKIRNYPYHRYAEVHLTANSNLKGNASITARLSLNKDERTIATKQIELKKTSGNALVRFDTGTLEPGEYTVKADIDAKGQLVETVSGILKIFPKPAWFDNTIAIDHSVPPPWKEIETIPNGNKVLLREYKFDDKVMFQQIINQQSKMLRKPPVFKLKLANSKEIDLSQLPAASKEHHPDKVIRQSAIMSSNAKITLSGILEFDGCMRYDLRIEPPKDGLLVENLLLSMELEPFWGNMVVAGTGTNHAVEKINGVRKYPFRPYNYLGGDNGGIALFVESEENWTQEAKDAICIEAAPQKGSSMTLQMVSGKGVRLTRPFTYTIGAIATPVRKHNGNSTYLTHWSRSRNEQLIFAENITYPPLPALPQGMLELLLRKTEDNASPGPIVTLEISGKDISLRNDNGIWIFSYDKKLLAKVPGQICCECFGCLRLSWSETTGYQASFDGNELFKDIQLPCPEKAGAILTLGVKDAWKNNEQTSFLIDALCLAREASSETNVLQDEYDE
ncbi:MAG: carbohydrate-binding family 9-like protein, partial [Victivallales bacterium]|nr:carbohydrate-binding family 9-like protein [Victivallales bacterium]